MGKTLNFVGMGMDINEERARIEKAPEGYIPNFRVRTQFHAKYGSPIFVEFMTAPIYKTHYKRGSRMVPYKKPRKVSEWGVHVAAIELRGSDPCNEHRLFDDIIAAEYTEKDILDWINAHFGTEFEAVYVADEFDEFTCDMFSEDWTADKELHDKRKAAYERYYEEVKEAEKGVKRMFYPGGHRPGLSVVGKDENTITIRNYGAKEYVEEIGLERVVVLEL